MSSSTTTEAVSETLSRPIRSEEEILAAISVKNEQLLRARKRMLERGNLGAVLGGRRIDNGGPLLRLIWRFEDQLEELKDELFKRRCLELWLERLWDQVEPNY